MMASLTLIVLLLAGAGSRAWAASPSGCERAAEQGLRTCVKRVSTALRRCQARQGIACINDAAVARELVGVAQRIARGCPDVPTMQAAGWPPLLTPTALAERVTEACRGEAMALAARSFGGPHGAAYAAAPIGRACLEDAQRTAAGVIDRAFKLTARCVLAARRGRTCDVAKTEARIDASEAAARVRIEAHCPALQNLVALDPATFVARARAQARCLLATALPDTAPWTLDCGPRSAVPVPPRGTPTRVILDEATWGTRCGDGSPYVFWIRLPPAGQPVENVVVHLQGGGVCVFEDECAGVSSGLLRATDNTYPEGGILSNDPGTSPFASWTKVELPYCTQDLHIGGGATSDFPSRTVHRFGGLNVRAALRWVRDALWAELDATSPEGYRPDRVRVLFTGTSAGAYGVAYNYHWVLDDLRWPRTTAVPDSGLGLDNGELIGIGSLGFFVLLNEMPPIAWSARTLLPPYCFAPTCGVGPVLLAATAPRLEMMPEQQVLSVSNQVDSTQVATTFFDTTAQWIDALRTAYCATQGLPGLHYFMPANPASIHGIVASTPRFTTMASGGVVIRDWLADAVAAPGAVVDRVEEGGLVGTQGAMPFACPVD
jgi:Pectinacetylesterase